jgi:hypothetical protein
MKTVSFRNSSQLISSILSNAPATPSLHESGVDLEFSTFRSEDYHYFSFPEDDHYELEDLTSHFQSDDSDDEASSTPSKTSLRPLCFRNSKALINHVLFPKKLQSKHKRLTFRNNAHKMVQLLNLAPKMIS